MVEPVFRSEDLAVTRGTPSVYETRSEGSGKRVQVHFCPTCGTKLYLTFERFPGMCGVYAGTFDDPDWFVVRPETGKHVFIDAARRETILPAGMPLFGQHAITKEHAPIAPIVLEEPRRAGPPTP